jgi:Animal haem peroxidase
MKAPRGLCIVFFVGTVAGSAGTIPPPPRETPSGSARDDLIGEENFRAFHFFFTPPARAVQPKMFPLLTGPAVFPDEFRSFDGTGNNQINPLLGSTNTPFLRTTTNGYGDGSGTPGGAGQKGTREISNLVDAQTDLVPAATTITDFVWQWGQFLDHDMALTPIAVPAERFNIPVPACDPTFDPGCTGTKTLSFQRSAFVVANNVREQVNVNTAFIDGSQVYGSDDARAQELRLLDGTGKLKTSDNNLLPFNVNGFPNEPKPDPAFFLAGDVRANEQSDLTCLHTLFLRDHNFWADHFRRTDRTLDDNGIYFRARAMVCAEIQLITYRDFLPILLGKNALTPYTGYDETVDPSIANVFAAAAFRFGHSMLPPDLSRLDANNQSIGDLLMDNAFFRPDQITGFGIEPYLRGLAKQRPQEIDNLLINALRNDLPGIDLAALNMQRGRDHGMPPFNQVRQDYGLPALTSFAELTSDPDLQAKLASAYATIEDIDAWVGMISEKHSGKAMMGLTAVTILKDQFQRLRDGDRFWYEAYLDPTDLATIKKQTLSGIIRRNTTIGSELQKNVFVFQGSTPTPTPTP